MTKPGVKTTEFWLSILAAILINAGAIAVPDKWKAITTSLVMVGYALSRGLAKLNTPTSTVPLVPTVTQGTQGTAQGKV